ncbi:hypothetical protein [Anaeromyxobacter sp. Fw109-5]|nr:hypothetical protein [Anaeromyxobacter sp. Fw109-5]
MDADFDADLEQLETGHCTARPQDELFDLVSREQETDGALDGLDE